MSLAVVGTFPAARIEEVALHNRTASKAIVLVDVRTAGVEHDVLGNGSLHALRHHDAA